MKPLDIPDDFLDRNRRETNAERLRRLEPEMEFGWGVLAIGAAACASFVAVLFGAPPQLIIIGAVGLIAVVVYIPTGASIKDWLDRGTHPAARPRPTATQPAAAVLRPGFLATRARLERVKEAYGTYESDPLRVLRLPALADVRVAATARFVDDLAAALVLDVDEPTDRAADERFAAAVDQVERSWRAAREHARLLRDSRIPPAERAAVSRVITLLITARRSPTDNERLTAYALARSELARLETSGALRLPRAAQAVLAGRARGELPGGTPTPAE
jgi:hypothetical protein